MKMAPPKNADTAPVNGKNKATDSIVRVNVAVLDRLMNLAGELVLSRNQLILAVSNGTREGLEAIASRVDQVTSELQETIMQTRMQHIGTVFGRFPRVVRDLSNKFGKECVLDFEGDEVEVDKTIVEAMGDPLTHLVRNSVDHGIETPDKRKAAGKSAAGRVRLRAFHQAGKVCIRIEDDGAGMDPVRLKTKAIEKGIITVDQAATMSDNEALRLIFAPGFSAAAQVTDVSGRGIGMDVIKTKIEQLGGTVDLESNLGQGSAVHITLPLTLAIVPSMVVGGSGERYAVPQANIVELVGVPDSENDASSGSLRGEELHRLLLFTNHSCEQFAVQMAMVARIERIKASEIRMVGSQNILIYRGQSLPILRLEQKIAALPPEFEPENLFVIVFRAGDRELGLVAPTLKNIRDVQMVIDAKTLREPGVLGAVIVDNTTTRVLDLLELVRLKYADWFQEENSLPSEKAVETTTILLAEDSEFFRNHVTRTLESEEFKAQAHCKGTFYQPNLPKLPVTQTTTLPHVSSLQNQPSFPSRGL